MFTEVKTCSETVFGISTGHGKSPWFLRLCVLAIFGVDGAVSVFASVNVEEFSECAF